MRWCINLLFGALLFTFALSAFAQDSDPVPDETEAPPPAPEVVEEEGAQSDVAEQNPEQAPAEVETPPEPIEPPPPPVVTQEAPPPEPPAPPPPPVVQAAPEEDRSVDLVEPALEIEDEIEDEDRREPRATSSDSDEGSGSRTRQGLEETHSDALPFRGTSLTYENIFNAYQLKRDNDITYNPYYAMSFSFRPRWYFMDELSIRLRIDMEVEITDADDTTSFREPRVSDLMFDLVYDPIVEIPGIDVGLGLGFRFQFPTSPLSQAATQYLGLGPELRLSRVFDVADGLLFGYTFRYMKYLNRNTTLETETDRIQTMGAAPDPESGSDVGIEPGLLSSLNQIPSYAKSHGFFNRLMIQIDFLRNIRPMSVAFMVLFINYLKYEPNGDYCIENPYGGPCYEVGGVADPQRHSASIWYVLDISVELTDYLGLSLGASTLSPQLQPDSTYEAPIFNRYTNVYIDLSLDFERLVAAVRRR